MELSPQKINHGSFFDISKAIHQAKIKKASIVFMVQKIIHIFPEEQHQQIVKTNKISNS